MNRGMGLFSGLGLGAGLMYLLDPDRGHSRRMLIRDKAVRLADATADGVEVGLRDLSHRAGGAVASVRSRLFSEAVPDEVLVERVRARIGHVVSHPHAIVVTVHEGHVTLSGPILAKEVAPLMATVATVAGVLDVDEHLEVHQTPGHISSLQGVGVRRAAPELFQENWAPGTRLVAVTTGGLMTLYGLTRRGLVGSLLGTLGVGLMTRGISNLPPKRLLGIGAGRRGIAIQKTVNVQAPIDLVFDFWSHPENFPRFMPHIQEVRSLGGGRHHWVVAGPAGVPVEWDASITELSPNHLIAWRSDPGAAVQHIGMVHFEPNPDGGTRIHVQMAYNPPAGAVGHAVASLLAADPKHEMDSDFVQLKQLLESESVGQVREG